MVAPYPGGGGKQGAMFPPSHAEAVTPDDTPETALNVFQGATGIWVGASGDVRVRMRSGADVTLKAVQAGVWHPLQFVHVFTTGTAATDIVAGGQ